MTKPILLFLNMSGGEIFIILLIVLVLFGAEGIPKFAKSAGKILFQIRNATDEIKRDIQQSANNIKKDIMDQQDGFNPLNDIKKDLDDTINKLEE